MARNREITLQSQTYLDDCESVAQQSINEARKEPHFGELFRTCLACSAALADLKRKRHRPKLELAQDIARKIPLLAAIGQADLVAVELRRFIELSVWCIYFSDHPVEWRVFLDSGISGFATDQRSPLQYAARRELSFFIEYAREFLEQDSSGLGIEAIDGLKQVLRKLNSEIHAGSAVHRSRSLLPYEVPTKEILANTEAVVRKTFAFSCIAVAAANRSKFDSMLAGSRKQFDWLIGSSLSRKMRSQAFGF